MAVSLLSHGVSDLCLGKPALRSLPISATVDDALSALKTSGEPFVSVWTCNQHHREVAGGDRCRCVGKVCMVDVICFLARDDNLSSPSAALKSPVSALLTAAPGVVVHVEPSSSLLEAIDLILQGAQNLVVPIQTRFTARRKQHHQKPPSATATLHNGGEYCWLTQEDVVRFLLSSIGLFSPLPALSVAALGLISTAVLAVDYHSPAAAAVPSIRRSLADHTSVAVIDGDGTLIGEISPFTLACCDETVAAAITTLSSGDLMAYIDCGGPPEDLVRVVEQRMKGKMLEEFLNSFSITSSHSFSSSSSSDDDSGSGSSPARRQGRASSYSARMGRRSEAIVCHRKSSLAAVMIQAIAHRVSYVWVIEEDCSLVGIVTFCNMLEVFREQYLLSSS